MCGYDTKLGQSTDLMMFDMSGAKALPGFDIDKPLAQRSDFETGIHEILLRCALAELERAFHQAVKILLKYTQSRDSSVHLYWQSMITRVDRAEALKLEIANKGVDGVDFNAMAGMIMPTSGSLKATVATLVKTPAPDKRMAAAGAEQGLSKRARKAAAARDPAAAGKQGGGKRKGALGGQGKGPGQGQGVP